MIIKIKNLVKKYNNSTLFDNFDIEIPENKLTTIYGASGSGKSTLLNIMGLIEDYDDGEFYLFGEFAPIIYSSKALLMRRNMISYLFQNFALIEDDTIENNLKISLFYKKLKYSQKKMAMKKVLERLNIKHSLKTKVYSLSGGEKQRIAIARALLKDSPLILADEPTGSLDINNRNEILSILREEIDKGKTVVIVTHDNYIREISDYVIEI